MEREDIHDGGRHIPPRDAMRLFFEMLGHKDLGVTELRAFGCRCAWVAYTDNLEDAARLCREMDGEAAGTYAGLEPRPVDFFDRAPNCWVRARGGPDGNCARDRDIEYITGVFALDADCTSEQRAKGRPASEEELQQSLRAARLVSQQDGLAPSSATILCSGNGHHVIAPVLAIPVNTEEIARQYRCFCEKLVENIAGQFERVRVDCVGNLSRLIRVPATLNRKGGAGPGRPHRRAYFVTEPVLVPSRALHHQIVNTEVDQVIRIGRPLPMGLKCDLKKIERCPFIVFCREHAQDLSEPMWVAMVLNLVPLEGGIELIHRLSALDVVRYRFSDTQRLVERVLREGYKPVNCRTIMSPAMVRSGRVVFRCPRFGKCPARAPMYMAANRTVYPR
jgi:hypothetical protein